MRKNATGVNFVRGEEPDREPPGLFSKRMKALKKTAKLGKVYKIRHKTYVGANGGNGSDSKVGTFVTEKAVMIGKYSFGALFEMEQGWREFFTWQELAAGLKGI